MHRLFCLLLFAIVVKTAAFGQTSFFLDVRGNFSAIPTYEKSVTPSPWMPAGAGVVVTYPQYELVESYESKPGLDLQLGISQAITPRISVESGIGLSLVNYKKEVIVENAVGSEPTGPIITTTYPGLPIETLYGTIRPGDIKYLDLDSLDTDRLVLSNHRNHGKTRLLYFSIPVNVNYMIIDNRLSVGGGFSASILVFSRQSSSQVSFNRYFGTHTDILERWGTEGDLEPSSTQLIVTENIDKSGSGLTNVLWNGNVQVQYRFFRNAWVNAGFHQSFTRIYEQREESESPAKNRLVKLGLRYYLVF